MTTSTAATGKFHFCIDRGGTFTDIHSILPDGRQVVRKLLSEDPSHYADAPTEGIRRVLQEYDTVPDKSTGTAGQDYPRGKPIDTKSIGSIRMGTTVATNALLERKGARMALLITRGFRDLLEIGNQARPDIFDLSCASPSLLYEQVAEIDERVVLEEFYPNGKDDSAVVASHVGLTGETVLVLKEPQVDRIRADLQRLKDSGVTALAVCLMHSYVFPGHELAIGKIAQEIGFEQISLSSQVMPMIKMVSR